MCGIAGILHYGERDRSVDFSLLRAMNDRLAHRGPDDEGVYVAGPIGLANRRLAIVDLARTGHQPMVSAGPRSALTYNGEFYNHHDFRSKLESRACAFRGTSDTETLLYTLEQWGPDALHGVAGIFALAWWDALNQRLILARDPLGVKQLYFHDNGERVVFASEIKALFECPGVPRELDPVAANEYLHFHTPLYQRTFFKGIEQVRPGEYIEVSRNGLRRKSYWQTDGFQPRSKDLQANVEELRALIGRVVRDQLMSDVPVGAFLSGGIDSSAVAAFAKRAGRPPRCFGVHFSNQGVVDERPFQEATAKALGLDLELTTLDGNTFPDDLLKLMYFQDQPVIGPAMIPMYYVSRLASRHVKVCLGGQAADEIFGGYARYGLVHPGRVVKSILLERRMPLDGVPQEYATVGGNLLKQLLDPKNLRRALHVSIPFRGWAARYFDNFAVVPEAVWHRIFDPGVVSRRQAYEQFRDGIARSPAVDPGDRVLHWDMQTYLPGLLHQDDRMSMANGLESRVPLADPRVVRFALHTSFDLKIRAGASKWILRQAVADVIPGHVLNRRKVGFDTPAEQWMRGRHRDFVRDLLLSTPARMRGWWKPDGVEWALNNTQSPHWFDVVWKLACVEAWARVFLDGDVPIGVSSSRVESARP